LIHLVLEPTASCGVAFEI